MKKKPVQIWVDPDFKKDLRVFAAKKGVSIMEASKIVSDKIKKPEEEPIEIKKFKPKYRI